MIYGYFMTIDCQEIRNLFLFNLFSPVFTWDNFCRRYKGSILTFLISIAQVSLAAADFAFNEFLKDSGSIAEIPLVAIE